METWDAVQSRRNVREYTEQPIAPEDLERILEAGRRAPSAGNWQPWHFVVVTDREQLGELAKAWERGGKHIARAAAAIVLVVEEQDDPRQRDWLYFDCGQATAQMMITAADLGIGAGHSAVSDQDQARKVLGFPDGHYALAMFGLGHPAGRPLRPIESPARRPLDEVVHWGRW